MLRSLFVHIITYVEMPNESKLEAELVYVVIFFKGNEYTNELASLASETGSLCGQIL